VLLQCQETRARLVRKSYGDTGMPADRALELQWETYHGVSVSVSVTMKEYAVEQEMESPRGKGDPGFAPSLLVEQLLIL
jgi:hypothetical protein